MCVVYIYNVCVAYIYNVCVVFTRIYMLGNVCVVHILSLCNVFVVCMLSHFYVFVVDDIEPS